MTAFVAYVTLFPQLIADPSSATARADQLVSSGRKNLENSPSGIHRFTVGDGPRVLLANAICQLWGREPSQQELTMAGRGWASGLCFQIYFDFFGTATMAIVLGRMFGFEFLENFNYPIISRSG